jgi:hypothetical protein
MVRSCEGATRKASVDAAHAADSVGRVFGVFMCGVEHRGVLYSVPHVEYTTIRVIVAWCQVGVWWWPMAYMQVADTMKTAPSVRRSDSAPACRLTAEKAVRIGGERRWGNKGEGEH